MESDWQTFRALIPVVRERYLAAQNVRIAGMLSDPLKTESERFWDAHEAVQEEARTLRDCLDGTSRSKMVLALIKMQGAGMLKREDLAGFSAELQQRVLADY